MSEKPPLFCVDAEGRRYIVELPEGDTAACWLTKQEYLQLGDYHLRMAADALADGLHELWKGHTARAHQHIQRAGTLDPALTPLASKPLHYGRQGQA